MLKLIGALLVGILSTSLAVIYQNNIAAFLGRAPVTVQMTASGWYPLPQKLAGDKSYSDADNANIASFGDPKQSNFARITISNNTGREIPNAYIKIADNDPNIWKSNVVVLKEESGKLERDIIENASDVIDIGPLPAAKDTTAYLWSGRGFGSPFDISDVEILTTDGTLPQTITRLQGDSDDLFLGISTETIAWSFVFILVAICLLLLFLFAHGFSFSKALLKDEDYYLAERIRFDANPAKYSVPDKLPKE
jgi:hypothetical protein